MYHLHFKIVKVRSFVYVHFVSAPLKGAPQGEILGLDFVIILSGLPLVQCSVSVTNCEDNCTLFSVC